MPKPLDPHPSALIESMRSMGYRAHTAIADLVDNSIAAGAKNVAIEIDTAEADHPGWVRIEDDGCGMSGEDLREAMRWGGNGPRLKRSPKDLGRFGLGMKTASIAFGRRLTVISVKDGKQSSLRWDLDYVMSNGWQVQKGIAPEDKAYLKGTRLLSGEAESGTIVLVTRIDRLLKVDGYQQKDIDQNRSTFYRVIREHLSLVFHRFLEKKSFSIRLGEAVISPTNLFGPDGTGEQAEWLKASEKFSGGKVLVRSFLLPHCKTITPEVHERLGGPSGWNAHQGFLIYRADRLIVPGGWLGIWRPEEHCKLARITIDLPNEADADWGLNVVKSKVSPPAILRADLERIGHAARRQAMQTYRFHGERIAPVSDGTNTGKNQPFWHQIPGTNDVRFRINRGHPLVEALIQGVREKKTADAFLNSFERLLPISAILQDPAKTTHGLAAEPSLEERDSIIHAFRLAAQILIRSGHSKEEAAQILGTMEPFSQIRPLPGL